MLQADNIKTTLFSILCICFVLYLFLGIYSYKKDKNSKVNVIFLFLCICAGLWSIGYAFMLISPNIKIANMWRIVALVGSCFIPGIVVSFVFSLKNVNENKSISNYDF